MSLRYCFEKAYIKKTLGLGCVYASMQTEIAKRSKT